MRLVDVSEVVLDYSGLAYINPYDFQGIAKYFAKQIARMPTIEPEQHWIPCSERLPYNEKRVLCTVQSGEHFCVVPCIFIQSTRRWLPEVYGNHDNVVAWMPMPEPYQGEGEQDE